MSKNIRVSLIDPMLYQSTYINHDSTIKTNFWKKFSLINFIFNILLPISIIIFVLFVLKDRYMTKKQNSKKLGRYKYTF